MRPTASSSVVARIQHHPSRAELLGRLVPGLEGLPVEVIEHQSVPPSPWDGYRLCLADLPPECEHVLVVQDDAIPCRNLAAVVPLIAARFPDNAVCLFTGRAGVLTKRWMEQAIIRGDRYSEVHPRNFLPVVAVLWPRAETEDILDWWDGAPKNPRRPERSDDGQLGRWMKQRRKTVYATIPSLVEHPDDVVSTIKKRPNQRTALYWIGTQDPLDIDW